MVSWCSQVMPLSAALKLAKKERMDLMPVAARAKPPVFRLGDADEAARQKRLRERELRRRELENRRKTLMKEARASLPACSLATPALTRLPAAYEGAGRASPEFTPPSSLCVRGSFAEALQDCS